MNNKILSNMLWTFTGRCGSQIVQFIVSIVLARMIAPEDFGTISIVLVFTNLLQVFIDSGIATSLIQKKDADDLDFSTVFYFNICLCIVLYGIMFAIAPLISSVYKDNSLTLILRILSSVILISAVKNIQQAYIARTMQFNKLFKATLSGTIVSGVVGIAMAAFGCGVWALVAQKIINEVVGTIVLSISLRFKINFKFSLTRSKPLLGYSWKLLASTFIDTLYMDIQQLFIGGVYSTETLAFYSRGKQFPNIIVNNINASIDSVIFPVMAKTQDSLNNTKSLVEKTIKTSTFIMAPMMVGLMAIAPTLISVILTDEWLSCVPYMYVFCFTYLFQSLNTANMNALKAIGKTDVLLKYEIIKKTVCLSVLAITMFVSEDLMLIGILCAGIISQIISAFPNRKILNYGYINQIIDISPSVLSAIIMGVCIKSIELLQLSNVIILLLQVGVGVIVYLLLAIITRNKEFQLLCSAVKRKK